MLLSLKIISPVVQLVSVKLKSVRLGEEEAKTVYALSVPAQLSSSLGYKQLNTYEIAPCSQSKAAVGSGLLLPGHCTRRLGQLK